MPMLAGVVLLLVVQEVVEAIRSSEDGSTAPPDAEVRKTHSARMPRR